MGRITLQTLPNVWEFEFMPNSHLLANSAQFGGRGGGVYILSYFYHKVLNFHYYTFSETSYVHEIIAESVIY